MGNLLKLNPSSLAGVLCLGLTLPLGATTVFDNTVNDLKVRFNPTPGTLEVGDEIVLGGTERYLTNFSFEFWGQNSSHSNAFSGTIKAEVRFYVNNGGPAPVSGYPQPGTMFFDSGLFPVPSPTDRNTFDFTTADFPLGLPLFMPTNDFTWSVQFSGMAGDDSVGVDLFSPPTTGQDYPDYWQYQGGSWVLLTNTVPVDFAARFEASSTVPEPSVVTLSLLGGLGLLGFAYRLRRNK